MYLSIDRHDQIDYVYYKIWKPKGTPIIKEFEREKDNSELGGRLYKNLAWVLAATSGNQKGIEEHEDLDSDKVENGER